MRVQQCKNFGAVCSCQQSEVRLLSTARFSEHFFSLILYAIVTRNTGFEGGPTGLGPDVVGLVCDPSLEHEMQYKVRCDGTITVGTGFDDCTASYNYSCMPLVFALIESWKGTHPESRYIRTLDRFVKASIGEPDMKDAIALIELYAVAARSLYSTSPRHWPHTDEHQALMRNTGILG